MCIYFACSGFLPSNFSLFYKMINGKVSKITLDFCLIMIFVITLVWFHDLYPACFFLFIFFSYFAFGFTCSKRGLLRLWSL